MSRCIGSRNHADDEAPGECIRAAILRLEQSRLRCEAGWTVLTFCSVALTLLGPGFVWRGGLTGAWLAAGLGVTTLLAGLRLRRDLAERFAIELELCRSGDGAAIGPLFESLTASSCSHRAELIRTLTRLLDAVEPSRFPQLTPGQRDAMRRAAIFEAHPDLVAAILHRYVSKSNASEYATVRLLAYGILTRSRDPRIQASAQFCLNRMVSPVPDYSHNDLLRPTDAPLTALLRPAATCPGPCSVDLLTPFAQRPVE